MLYATGIRVSELCGLDVDDVDSSRRLLRVLGKGNKQRTVPFGEPAQRALAAWLADGRPRWPPPDSGPALLLGARGGRLDPRQARTVVHQTMAAVAGAPDIGPHGLRHSAATHLLEGGADLASSRNCSATRAGDHPALHARDASPGCARCTTRPIRGLDLAASRLEPDRRRHHQSQRIDVVGVRRRPHIAPQCRHAAAPHPGWPATSVPMVARVDQLTRPHQRLDGLVAGAQTARVGDRDHRPVRERPANTTVPAAAA